MLAVFDFMPYTINVMAKTRLTTTGPLGLTATRSTDRTYTHAVWTRITEPTWLKSLTDSLARHGKEAKRYEADIDTHGPMTTRWGSAVVQEWVDSSDAAVIKLNARLAAGYEADTSWKCVTWCGRPDLAVKAAGTFHGCHVFTSEVAA